MTISRKKMPSIEAAASGDVNALRLWLKHLDARATTLEQSTGNVAYNSDTQSPVNPAPPRAQVQVRPATSGILAVTINNPQFLSSSVPGKKVGNFLRAPITHSVEYSADGFKTVSSFPPSVQNHYSVPTNGKTLQFRIKSSLDGVTFNTPQVTKGFSG